MTHCALWKDDIVGTGEMFPVGAHMPANVPAHVPAHVLAHVPAYVQGTLWQGLVCTFQEHLGRTGTEHLIAEKQA